MDLEIINREYLVKRRNNFIKFRNIVSKYSGDDKTYIHELLQDKKFVYTLYRDYYDVIGIPKNLFLLNCFNFLKNKTVKEIKEPYYIHEVITLKCGTKICLEETV